MSSKPFFHHALTVDKEICIGCSNCMKVCPTEAIRIKNGKANIHGDKCVDCGYCYKACPVSAIFVEQNDLDEIFNYKVRVALIPSVFVGQFPEKIRSSNINRLMEEIGFTHVFDVEHTVDFLQDAITKHISSSVNKPIISTFCPAIIRLIQVRFPALIDNLLPYKPPIDLAATYCRKMLNDRGIENKDIGLFYITPCAAKIAAVKSPVGEKKSLINGVINMNLLYNRLYRIIKNDKTSTENNIIHYPSGQLSKKGVLWCLTNGEADNIQGRNLAIDGMENVIEFLNKVEDFDIEGVDFLELRACDEGCAGGILNPSNRFLTVERLKKRAKKYDDRLKNMPELKNRRIEKYYKYLEENINTGKVVPRSIDILDQDIEKAMKKMQKAQKLMCYLPGFDCGACGAPTCNSLAQDIAKNDATLSHCIFMQRMMEKHHKLSPEHSFRIIEKIWGKDRLNKDCNKKGASNENI
ncbi:MAG: [Fe-Fe] hydrogenase large subunit C-terminal domain-containing protein [Bacteroidales bacterium]